MYLGSKQKRLEQRTKNDNLREYMLISLGNLGKPFWLRKHIFTNRKDQKQTYTKNHTQELHDRKV